MDILEFLTNIIDFDKISSIINRAVHEMRQRYKIAGDAYAFPHLSNKSGRNLQGFAAVEVRRKFGFKRIYMKVYYNTVTTGISGTR